MKPSKLSNLHKYIKELEEKCTNKKNTKSPEVDKARKELEEKVRNLLEVVDKKDKILHKIEYENIKLRTLLEEKARECEIIKKEILKINKMPPRGKELQSSGTVEMLKKKFELSKNQKLTERSPSVREYSKSDRRSLGESEMAKLTSSPTTKRDNSTSIKKEDSKSNAKIPPRGHARSISDHKLAYNKRTPSR